MLSRVLVAAAAAAAACWLDGTPAGADMVPGMKIEKLIKDGSNIELRQP